MIFNQKEGVDRVSNDLITNITSKTLEDVKLAVDLSSFRQEVERGMFSEDESLKNEAKFNAEISFNVISKTENKEIKQIAADSISLLQRQSGQVSDVAKTEWMLLDGALEKKLEDLSTSSFKDINFALGELNNLTGSDKSLTKLFLIASVVFQIIILTLIYRIFVNPLFLIERNIDRAIDYEFPEKLSSLRINELFRLNDAIMMLHQKTKDNIAMQVSIAEEMDRARKVAEDKAEFMSSMNHEINTPLATIEILTYLIEKSNTNDGVKPHLEKLRGAVGYLNSLIERILKLSRMDAKKFGLEIDPFDLREVVGSAYKILEPVATRKGIALTIEVHDDIPRSLIGDPVNIKEIILNFASNAIKFTQSGSVKIKIENTSVEESAANIKISVSDTGCGIKSDEMHNLFQRFSQLHKRKFSGSGLGLAITKGLVDLMGGSVGVSSEVGKGSLFWACVRLEIGVDNVVVHSATNELPVRHMDHASIKLEEDLIDILLDVYVCARNDLRHAASIWSCNEHKFTSHDGPYFARLTDLIRSFALPDVARHLELVVGRNDSRPIPSVIRESGKPTVLIIDDTPGNLDTYGLLLDDISIVKVANNPVMGIEVAKRDSSIKLILLDISMPDMDGFDVIKTLKSGEATSSIPVIMISASELPRTNERCIESGAVAFIDRSKSPAILLELVKRILNSSGVN